MAIVGGFDIHRRQVTFDYLDTVTGQVRRGRIAPACRATLRGWLEQFAGRSDVTFAVEGCTGWRFVVEELARAGITPLLAEPAQTAHERGRKRRAKTDKTDARHLRTLVAEGKVPCSWIPPWQACELRALLQLYRDLAEEHMAWAQRIHATLFHQGVPGLAGRLSDPRARALLERGQDLGLSPAGAQAVAVALRRLEDLEAEITPVRRQIASFARRQPGGQILQRELYGVGTLVAAVVWAFLGDTRRFSSSAQAVRHAGLDITVYSSDDKRAPGHLSHQGPPILRWALFEAGHHASRAASPDHRYYTSIATRIDANRAALSVARKLARRSHHILRRLGDQAWAPGPHARRTVTRMRVEAAAPITPMHRGQPPMAGAPYESCRHPVSTGTDGLKRPARPHPAGPPHRSSCHRDHSRLADRGKAGRPPHPHTPIPETPPEEPMT